MDIKEQILVALGLNKAEEEIKLAWQSKGEDGTIYVSTAEELESGVDISVLTEDGTTILLPVGMYKMEDGFSFRVEKEGVVSEIMKKTEDEDEKEEVDEKEEMTEETELEKKKEDEDEDEDEDEEMKKRKKDTYMEEMPDWYKKTYEEMKDKVDNLMDAISDLKGKTGDVKEKDVKMSKENTEEKVELSSEDEIKNLKEENKKLKTELAASPADAPINTNKFSSDKNVLSKKELSKLTKREKYFYELYK